MFKPLLLIVIGVAFSGVTASRMFDDRAIAREGQAVRIEPMEEYIKTERKRHNQTSTSYSVDIHFVTESGERIRAHKGVSIEQLQALMASTATITYLPRNPKVNRIAGEKPAGWEEIAGGLLAVLVGGFWLRRSIAAPFESGR
jgi:hypothetical protein